MACCRQARRLGVTALAFTARSFPTTGTGNNYFKWADGPARTFARRPLPPPSRVPARPATTRPAMPVKSVFRGGSRSVHTGQNTIPRKYTSNEFTFPGFVGLFFAVLGASWYFKREKKRMAIVKDEALKAAAVSKGKPKIGGAFELVDTDGRTVTNEDYLGRFFMVYFGFTHCPDICPEELEKMTDVVDLLRANPEIGDKITPVFITCDPQRDGIDEVKQYVQDFHPDLVGLTGTFDQVAKACKAYRVYWSAPPDVAPGDDYLVDHSIFFYLMDPHGEFMDAYSREWTPGQVAFSVENHVKKYRLEGGAEGREAVLRQREERKRAEVAAEIEELKKGLPKSVNVASGTILDKV